MAITCAICGNKQSGWYTDYPLSDEYLQERICVQCNENLQLLLGCNDMQAYTLCQNYFISIDGDDTYKGHTKTYISNLLFEKRNEITNILNQQEEERKKIQYIEEENRRKEQTAMNIMLTTSDSFEKFSVSRYINTVSGESVLGTGLFSELSAQFNDLFGTESETLINKIDLAKELAQKKLITKAADLGANAILAIRYELLTIGNNMIVVSMYGTAVNIDPIID